MRGSDVAFRARGPHARQTSGYGRERAASMHVDSPLRIFTYDTLLLAPTFPPHSPSYVASGHVRYVNPRHGFPSNSCAILGSSSRKAGGGWEGVDGKLRAIFPLGYPVPRPRCSAQWRRRLGDAGRRAPRFLSALRSVPEVRMCGRWKMTIDANAQHHERTMGSSVCRLFPFKSCALTIHPAFFILFFQFGSMVRDAYPMVRMGWVSYQEGRCVSYPFLRCKWRY